MEIEPVNVGPLGDGDFDRYKLSLDGIIDEDSHIFEESLYLKSTESIYKFKSFY